MVSIHANQDRLTDVYPITFVFANFIKFQFFRETELYMELWYFIKSTL